MGPKVKVKNKIGHLGYGKTRDNPTYAKIAKVIGIVVGLVGVIVFILTLVYSII